MNFTYKNGGVFLVLIPHILKSEGGYVNNPRDRGGPTKYGVAWNFNADWLKSRLGMKQPTDIKNLTLDQARQLYYERYWLASDADGLTDIDLAYIHLDTAINCGVGTAARFLHRLSVDPKHYDGTGGKNRTLFLTLFLEYTAQRLSFYTHARDRDVFLEGWINRMVDVIRNSLNLD